jgi:CHAT domain-containing protein/tetratricopeptide (TPR) repeat protein
VPVATCLVFFLTLALAGSAQTPPSPPESVVNLSAGQALTLAVKPREYQTVRVNAIPGKYSELLVGLPGAGIRGRYVKVQPEPVSGPDAADPAISDSGQDFVRFPLPDTAAVTVLHVTVLTNSKADSAPVEVHLSLVSSEPSQQKLDEAKALASFNHGERLRRSHAGGDKALAAYQDALNEAKLAADPVLEQQILLSTGRMLLLDGKHYAESIGWERQAVAVPGTDSAPSVQAMAWKTLGGALLDSDRYAESLQASGRALAIYEKTGETFWQGVVLENMGEAELNLGDVAQALQTEQRALDISRTLHDDFGVVETLATIGSIDRSRGEYQAALNDFSEAVEVSLPSTYNPMQGEAWAAMGELHRDLDEPLQAASDFAKALEIAQHTSNGLDELEAMQEIASLHLAQGDAQAAQSEFSRALARSRELKLLRPQSAMLIGMARTSIALRHADDAEPPLRQAIELSQSIHQDAETAEAYATLGRMAESIGHPKDAQSDFAEAARLYGEIPDKAGLAEADSSLARVEAANGDFPAALVHLNQAMDIVESSRTSFSRGALRTRFFAAQRATYDQAIALLMDQDHKQPDRGFAAQAWRVAERARARSLLDELWAAQPSAKSDNTTTDLRQRLAAAEVRIDTLEEQQAQVGTASGDLPAAAKIRADLRSAVLAADELESRIRSAEPATAAMPLDRLTPAAFASTALALGDALVEYWVGSNASYAWLIASDGSCTGYRLPVADALLERTSAYRQSLLARNVSLPAETLRGRDARIAAADGRTSSLARSLAETLFPAPLAQKLSGIHRLVLVSDGPLAQLPFAGLRLSAQYLIERFELVNEPSAAYLTPTSPAKSANPLRVAIFADPVYNLADSRLTAHESLAKPIALSTERAAADLTHLPRLPGSRQEALKIAEIAGPERASLSLGFDATPAEVHAIDWNSYPVAHFALHAISQTSGRDSAGMLLSMFDARGQRQDGILWVRDIYSEHLARELVVLSGCGTALGETVPGEGMNSLARAFLFSGTRQVAATLWSADDAGLTALMERFYRELMQRGKPAAEALREAQLEMMQQTRFAAPIYWAGFTVEGQWKTH